MKLPKKIRIGAFDYDLNIVENLRSDNDNKMNGSIAYDIGQMEITTGITRQSVYATLWHEVLHGIIHHSGNAIKHEELTMEMFANGIVQVIRDNPWITNWLEESENK